MSLYLDEILKQFKEADKDGNGKLDAKELKLVLKSDKDFNDCTDSQLNKIIDSFMVMADEDGDNMLNYEELIKLEKFFSDEIEPDARQLFKLMFNSAKDDNGTVSKKYFAKLLEGTPELMDDELLSAEDLELAAKIIDTVQKMAVVDEDGRLSYESFLKVMN